MEIHTVQRGFDMLVSADPSIGEFISLDNSQMGFFLMIFSSVSVPVLLVSFAIIGVMSLRKKKRKP